MAFEILATCPRSALQALRAGLASRRRRLTLAVALLLLGLLVACAPSISEREAVHVLTYDGTVAMLGLLAAVLLRGLLNRIASPEGRAPQLLAALTSAIGRLRGDRPAQPSDSGSG